MKFTILNKISIEILKLKHKVRVDFSKSYEKVFVIGMNKTGTTTLYASLSQLGFEMGDSRVGEVMAAEYFQSGVIRNLDEYIASAQAFQDVPFSIPRFYEQLAKKYPKAKFILSIRGSSEQWLNSLKKYQTARVSSKSNNMVTEGDIEDSKYVFSGWTQIMMKGIFNYPNVPLYSSEFKKVYEQHNMDAINYFRNNKEKLLVINVAQKNSIKEFYEFLEVPVKYQRLTSFKQYNKS
tara:strand:- start:236 stop:943 length:708 start_codon:yes stop_codon:yes gene_type:complete